MLNNIYTFDLNSREMIIKIKIKLTEKNWFDSYLFDMKKPIKVQELQLKFGDSIGFRNAYCRTLLSIEKKILKKFNDAQL